MVVRADLARHAQAVCCERLDRVLANHEDHAGIGAGVAQEAVKGSIAQALELELAGEDAAEVPHRLLDRVGPGKGANEAVERTGRRADLVGRVDRQRARLRVAGAPVLRVDGLPQALLHGSHPVREQSQTAPHHEPSEREVHRAHDETGGDGAGEEERGQDAVRRQPQQEAEGREDEPDHEPEPGHPDGEVDEDLGGEARHVVGRSEADGWTRSRTMRRRCQPAQDAMVRVGPVRSGRLGLDRQHRGGEPPTP